MVIKVKIRGGGSFGWKGVGGNLLGVGNAPQLDLGGTYTDAQMCENSLQIH